MGAIEIIGIALGSSVLTALIQAIVTRLKNKDDNQESYANRLERRIKTLEDRQEILEERTNIQQSAISCAWACKNKSEQDPCPVLQHMELNPMPMFNRKTEQQ